MAHSSAISVFPLAVGDARTRFLPSSAPFLMASSCGGYSSVMPVFMMTCFASLGIGRSVIFMWLWFAF